MSISAKDLLILLLVLIGKFQTLAQKVDEQFNPFIKNNPRIFDITVLTDGKIVARGFISSIGNQRTSSIIRLHPDGTLDSTFVVDIDKYDLDNVLINSDGKVLLHGNLGQGQRIKILSANGDVDENFQLDKSIPYIIKSFIQKEKHLLLTTAVGNPDYSHQIVRVNENGDLDSSFSTILIKDHFWVVKVLKDGKILVFQRVNGNIVISRFHKGGKVDDTFNTGTGFGQIDPQIRSIAEQPDGKILIAGGRFSSFNDTETGNFIRLNADGSLDRSFVMPGPTVNIFDYGVESIFVLPSGQILVSGSDNNSQDNYFKKLARLNKDGSLDTSFPIKKMEVSKGVGTEYTKMKAYGDTIYLAGTFSTYENEKRYGIGAITSEGELISSFNPKLGSNPTISTSIIQPDGKILIAGTFIEVNNTVANGIARLKKDGSLDTLFMNNIGTGANNKVTSLALQKDNKILVLGWFNKFNNEKYYRLVRLNPDGSLDPSFEINTPNLSFFDNMFLSEDEKILVLQRGEIVKFNKNGTVDNSFKTNIPTDFLLQSMTLQKQKIILGGGFIDENHQIESTLIRLNSDGSIDTTYNQPQLKGHVIYNFNTVADGLMLCSGYDFNHGNDYPNPLFQISEQGEIIDKYSISSDRYGLIKNVFPITDTTYLVGGNFKSINKFERFGLAKIDLKGRVYHGFRADVKGDVQQILPEDEDHILVYGNFNEVGNTKDFSGIARINISAPRPPMDVSVNLNEARGIQLTWKDSADFETGYKIYRASSNGSGFTLIDSVGAGVTTYLDTDIQPGINYSYQVVSYNDMFQSDFSDPVSVSTSQLNFPETPTELVLEDRNGSVYLVWTAEDANVLGYIVERSTGKEFVVLDTVVIDNFYDLEIEINVEYQYRVKAYNVLGDSEYSPVVLYSNEVTSIEAESFEKEHPAYPNPSNRIFIITLEQPVGAENVQIVDMQGKQLGLSDVMIQQDNNQLLIDLSEEIKGIYVLMINSGQKITSYRLVKR